MAPHEEHNWQFLARSALTKDEKDSAKVTKVAVEKDSAKVDSAKGTLVAATFDD